nr:MAG TPA: hypothetical protein [Caudoviricetes sp.]
MIYRSMKPPSENSAARSTIIRNSLPLQHWLQWCGHSALLALIPTPLRYQWRSQSR